MSVKVALIDHSAVSRQAITDALKPASDITVLTTAADPLIALQKFKDGWPDVIITDADLPRMDGVAFLRKILAEHPVPVIFCATPGPDTARKQQEAMAAGATAFVLKTYDSGHHLQADLLGNKLIHEVRAAMRSHSHHSSHAAHGTAPATKAGSEMVALAATMQERNSQPRLNADAMLKAPTAGGAQQILKTAQQIVVIGISTGGTQALEKLLPMLSANCVGLAIVQHMPETLTGTFAKRLNELSTITVKEAKDGDQIMPGQALIAHGGKHLMIRRSGVHYFVDVRDGPLVNRHRPSVDVLFRSAAVSAGINATGIIMTGMGDDGARGLKEMFDCGSHTIAQDEASCTVFGMPKEAIKLGGAKETLSLEKIAAKINGIH